MNRQYCSLSDARYLPQLLALYESILRHSSEDFTLHVLTLDHETWQILKRLKLAHVELIPLATFEWEMGLVEIHKTRTHQEMAWGCASQLCEWLMRLGLDEITYLDSDCMAFSDLRVAFDEIGNRSIAIALHRLIPSKKHLEVNGKWNVGWMTFRNTPSGRACVSKWSRQVRDRCSAEIGCGDQKYLEDFVPDHGANVCVFENIGVNAAPWNIGNWRVTEGPCVDGIPIVTFHAHETRFNIDGTVFLTNYRIRPEDEAFIYDHYVASVREAISRIAAVQNEIERKESVAVSRYALPNL